MRKPRADCADSIAEMDGRWLLDRDPGKFLTSAARRFSKWPVINSVRAKFEPDLQSRWSVFRSIPGDSMDFEKSKLFGAKCEKYFYENFFSLGS